MDITLRATSRKWTTYKMKIKRKNTTILSVLLIYVGVTLALSAILIYYYFPFKEKSLGNQPEIIASSSRILKVDSLRFFTVFGVIMNKLQRNIASIRVNVTFYRGNRVIAVGFGYSEIKILKPGEKSPFFIYLKLNQTTDVPTSYNLTLTYKETEEEPVSQIRIIESSSRISEEGYFIVTGTLENRGVRKAGATKIICAYYDSKGNLLFMTHSFVASAIEPYGRRTFTVSSKPLKISPARYELYIITSYEKTVTAHYELLILLILALAIFVIIMKRRGW